MKKSILIAVVCIIACLTGIIMLHKDAINGDQQEQVQQEDLSVQPDSVLAEDTTLLEEPAMPEEEPVVQEEPAQAQQPAKHENPAPKAAPAVQEIVEEQPKEEPVVEAKYIDLGLPSGTMWKSCNEECGLLTFDDAVTLYNKKLPTKKQITELQEKCEWTKTDEGYKVTGPNGNFIILPAAGYCNCSGQTQGVGIVGSYWSSTPDNKENAWRLGFEDNKKPPIPKVSVTNHMRCYGRAIRLVKKKN